MLTYSTKCYVEGKAASVLNFHWFLEEFQPDSVHGLTQKEAPLNSVRQQCTLKVSNVLLDWHVMEISPTEINLKRFRFGKQTYDN